MPPLADYGGRSGTGGCWIDEPWMPALLDDAAFTCDWGRGRISRHVVTPHGAGYTATQEQVLELPRATDLDTDAVGHVYVPSWRNGHSKWTGPDVGVIAGGCCHDYATQTRLLEAGIEERTRVGFEVARNADQPKQAAFAIYEQDEWAGCSDLAIHDECTADMNESDYVARIIRARRDGTPAAGYGRSTAGVASATKQAPAAKTGGRSGVGHADPEGGCPPTRLRAVGQLTCPERHRLSHGTWVTGSTLAVTDSIRIRRRESRRHAPAC